MTRMIENRCQQWHATIKNDNGNNNCGNDLPVDGLQGDT
jgi:hypothetical protein